MGKEALACGVLPFPITAITRDVGDSGDLLYLQSPLRIASGTAVLCEAMLLRNHSASVLCPLRAQQVMNGR
jgi:hypothetical protein